MNGTPKSPAILFYLLSVLFFTQQLAAQEKLAELDEYLQAYYAAHQVPSVVLGVAQKDKIEWTGSAGYSDIENNVLPSPEKTRYRIASISKTITAVAVMMLVEEGKINLDEDVRTYLPKIPKKKFPFTVRQVLNHTSGLRAYREGEFDSKIHFVTITDVLNYLKNDSLEAEPGTTFIYSSLAYTYLAAIIEKVSGLSFGVFLRTRIFEPMGMVHTVLDVQQSILPLRARGYIRGENRMLENAPLADLSIKYPGGGILSTAEDLLKFGIGIISEKLISEKTFEEMYKPTILKNGTVLEYGLGIEGKKDAEGNFYAGHFGGGTGFVSHLILFPETGVVAVHLINLNDRNIGDPAYDAAAIWQGIPISKPKKFLSDTLFTEYLNSGIEKTILLSQNIRKDSSAVYESGFSEMMQFGNDLLEEQYIPDAVIYYRALAQEFPKNIEVLHGLARAYTQDHNRGMALKTYHRIIEIDPNNETALKKIRELQGSRN